MKEKIIRILDENKSYMAYRSKIKKLSPSLDEYFSSQSLSYAEAVYRYLHDLKETPKCLMCGTELKYIDRTEGYRTYCSSKCAANSTSVKEKRKSTCMDTYGVDNPSKKFSVRQKAKNTMRERYGVEHALQNEKIKSKFKQSLQELDLHEKGKRAKQTLIKKYGKDNAYTRAIEQRKQTCLERYGVDHHFKVKEIRDKLKQTKLSAFVKSMYFDNATPQFNPEDYDGVSSTYKWLCHDCNNVFEDHIDDGSKPICTHCYPPHTNTSVAEKEILEYVQQIYCDEIIENDKSALGGRYEIDIYLPELSIGIEYCGLYWHSYNKRGKKYHQEKTLMAMDNGIRLIQIFEDEWLFKKDICKSRIKHIIGCNNKAITYARKCSIQEISGKDYKEFCEKYHIQGCAPASIKLGAFYNGEIVSVMSFGKRKILHNTDYELIRFCSIGNIPGIASKLFKHALSEYNISRCVSYCDLRWGSGDLYRILGFKCEHLTVPNYWYFKNTKRFHRYYFRKNKLVENGHNPSKTEKQTMKELGYGRIYDSGSYKFIYDSSGIDGDNS